MLTSLIPTRLSPAKYRWLIPVLFPILTCVIVCAQTPQAPVPGTPASPAPAGQAPSEQVGSTPQLRSNYVLRAGDQILIRAAEEEDLSSRPYLIDQSGFVDLPLLGKIQAAGVSLQNFETAVATGLKTYVVNPQVSVTVVQYASEPVFFLGAGLKATGLFPLVGQRNLMEMMESNGGLQPGASNRIKVTRHKEEGPIPLPNVIALPNGDTSVEINLKTLQANVNPAENIVLMPFDIVNVDLAGTVSVMGEVGHIGSFALQDRESMPVIQAVIEAGGLSTTAKPEDSFILRPITDTARHAVIPINLKLILKGEGNDQPLLANDVLVVGASHKLSQKDLLIFLPILGLAFTFVNIFAHL